MRGINKNKMGKFDGYLFLTDIDGTLTDSRGKVSHENSEAIKYFQSNGGLFTVATGRFPDFIENFADSFVPNSFIIGINGTVLYDAKNKTDVIRHTLDSDFYKIVIEIAETNSEIEYIDLAYRSSNLNIAKNDFHRLPEIFENSDRVWYKAIFCQKAEDTPIVRTRLIEKYGQKYNIDCSWPNGIEIHSSDSGKGEMLSEAVDILNKAGVKITKTIAVGDFENDISMIKRADIGYAVANAIESVKNAANRISVSNNENAIAKIIRELESEI